MCDFSVSATHTRDAAVGDVLVSNVVSNHGTIGFTAKSDKSEDPVAVCLMSGATLILSDIPAEKQAEWGVGEVATATFNKQTIEGALAGTYFRDGVIFKGQTEHVSLQKLPLGLLATVEAVSGQINPVPAFTERVLVPAT